MGGGGGGGGQQYVPEPQVQQTTFNPTGGGPVPTPQTFTQQGMPPWMNGWFSAPWWGMNAATGQPMGQNDLQAQQPAPAAQAQQAMPQAPAYNPIDAYRSWRRGNLAGDGWHGDNAYTYQDFLQDPASRFAESGRGMPGMAGVIWSMKNRFGG